MCKCPVAEGSMTVWSRLIYLKQKNNNNNNKQQQTMHDEFRPDYIGLFREGNIVWGWENDIKGIKFVIWKNLSVAVWWIHYREGTMTGNESEDCTQGSLKNWQ